jgi:DNA-binding NarL/FixJ family response regulator
VTGRALGAKGIILDPWPVARIGMRRVLETAKLECLLETGETEEALSAAKTRHADFLIIGGQAHDGPSVVRQAKSLDTPPVVAVLIGRTTQDELRGLLTAGADGLLARSAEPYEIVSSLRQLLDGERVVSPVLVPTLVGMGDADIDERVELSGPSGGPVLTPKECQILAKLAEGLSHDEIAKAMFVSFHTVKTHVSHIYAKLGVATRNGAVARGIALGLIS